MLENPIIVSGTGATKAYGGARTDDLLPSAQNGEMAQDDRTTRVSDREKLQHLTREFLRDCFNIPMDGGQVRKEDCPSLPMVLSMLQQ